MHEDDLMRGLSGAAELRINKLKLEKGDVLIIGTAKETTAAWRAALNDFFDRIGLPDMPILLIDAMDTITVLKRDAPCPRCGSPSAGECKRHDCARKAFDVVGGQGE